ncbi:MAG: hypothetical protein QM687_04260 [Ferruginibacter sp.]
MKKIYALVIHFVVLLISSNVSAQNLQWAWSKSYGNTGDDRGQKIAVDSRNGVYTFGTFTSSNLNIGSFSLTNNGGTDLFLCKHDTLGNLIWARSFGSTGADSIGPITADRSGDIIISGCFSNTISIGSYNFTSGGGKNIFVAKLNNAGNVIWAKHFLSPGEANSSALTTDTENSIIVGGNYKADISFGSTILTATNTSNLFYIKLDNAGNVVWAKKNSGDLRYSFTNVEILTDNRIIFLGRAYPTGWINFGPGGSGFNYFTVTYPSVFFVKLNTDGDFIMQKGTVQLQGSLSDPVISKLGNYSDIITAGSHLFLSGTTSSLYYFCDSNLIRRTSLTSTPVTNTSISSLATELAYSKKRLFFTGYSYGVTGYGNGFGVTNATGTQRYIYILEKDTAGVSKNLIYSTPNINSSIYYSSAIDTFTNTLYSTGNITSNAPCILNEDTLNGNGGNDILISKISINNYYFTMRDSSTCQGEPIGIGLNADPSFGQGPYTYSWTPTAGLSDPNAVRTYANPSATTAYTLQITDALGSSVTKSLTITVNPLPSTVPVITASGPLSFCLGNSVILTSSPATKYKWSNGATTQSITVTASGTYSVQVADGICFGPSSDPANVTVTGSPRPTITTSGPTNICSGSSVTLVSSAASGNIWSNGATTQSITVNTTGIYTVQIADGGCLSEMSEPINVTVMTPPAAPTITTSGTTNICTGSSVTLTSSATSGNIWSNGASTQSITVSASGLFSVQFFNGTCYSQYSQPVAVVVNPVPDAPAITANGPLNFCEGNSVTLTSSITSGNTWSNGATTQSITVDASGTYSVTTFNGTCTSLPSNPVTIQVTALPPQPTITASGPLSFCEGNSITLTSSATSGNIWSNSANTQSITVNTSGIYSVAVSNGTCTSLSSTPVTVQVNPLPAIPTITASGTTTFCEGNNVTLTASPAASYLWSNGATSQNITVGTSGTYSVIVSNGTCASLSSGTITVQANPLPVAPAITASGPLSLCEGNSITLSSSSATGNLWSNGATTQSIIVSVSGTYSVTSTNPQGCTSPSSVAQSVVVNALPAVPVITQNGNLLNSSSSSGNQWYLNGGIIPGATAATYLYTTPGDYSVTVTNADGCQSSSQPVTTSRISNTMAILSNGDVFFHQVSPNPVNGINGRLDYQLQSAARVSIVLINSSGTAVSTLQPLRNQPAGHYTVPINTANLTTGKYYIIYRINSDKITDGLIINR